jgi:hypothetical protein
MARFVNHLVITAFAALLCLGQSAIAAPAGQAPAQTSPAPAPATNDKPHGPMPAELTKSLDSKKLKEGDPVAARITAELRTHEGVTIPRNSKLIGHVTEAQARSKHDSQSALGIVFDKIVTPDGKEMAIKGVIQAVGPSPTSSGQAAESSIGPGMMAGHEGMGAGTTPPPMPAPNQGPQPSKPMLNPQSKGVVGIRDLELGENSVLISSGKEVKLDSGTQMIVQVEIE